MKTSFLTSVLIVSAVGLCGLCAFQWFRETSMRKELQALRYNRSELESALQQHTNTIHQQDARIAELTTTLGGLEGLLRTNENNLLELRAEQTTLQTSNSLLSLQIEAYAEAFSQATNRLNQAYNDIKKQNELVAQVTAQRDDYVARLNDSIQKRNEIVRQYNDLVKKVEVFQTGPNAPSSQP